jgi:dihydroorotase
MTTTVIQGGRVVDRQGMRTVDVAVDDETGTVVGVGPSLTGERVLDAQGCYVTPGFVDLHAHLRQPGGERSETIETGSRAAALGGYTAVVAMPDTDPCADAAPVISEVLALAKSAMCEVSPSAAITVGRQGTALAPFGELAALGVRLFTDSGRCVQDAGVMRRALEYAGGIAVDDGIPLVLAQHCQLDPLAGDGVMHEGGWSARLGLAGVPSVAEELIVMRDVALARLTGTRLHLHHVSTAGSVAVIRAAKAEGHPVTADVTPHHLVLTDAACIDYDPRFKVSPPLRPDADVAAVRAGLLDGTIDAIATDHGPCPLDAKEQPFDQAPFGAAGLETALAVLLTELPIRFEQLLPALSWRPADIAGLGRRHGCPVEVDRPANLVVVDPKATWTIEACALASRAATSPFDGRRVVGRVRHTIYRGEPVVVDAKATR